MMLLWLKYKCLPWLKKNWKWVLLPVGLASLLASSRAVSKAWMLYSEPPIDLEDKTRETLRKLRQREVEHDKQVAELEHAHQERLRDLSDEQQKSLEKLQGKPIKEVVSWFDKL